MKTNTVVLCLILLLALLVRTIGLGWYLPHAYQTDEYHTVGRALNLLVPNGVQLILTRNYPGGVTEHFHRSYFDPHQFGYPPLYVYIQAGIYYIYYLVGLLVGSFRSLADLDRSGIFLVGRAVTALLGVGTILLVYLVGKRAYSQKVGLVSSLFLSFIFFHVTCSRLITPDVPMVFFIVVSFWFTYLIYEKGRTRDYLLATLFAGFSVATKFTGAFLILPIFLAHIFNGLEKKKSWSKVLFDRKILLVFGGVALGFFIGCPLGLIKFSRLLSVIRHISIVSMTSEPGLAEMNSWLYYIVVSLSRGMGRPLQAVSLAGLAYAVIRHRKKDILLLSFPVSFFLFMGIYVRHTHRYIIPMFPFLVILAAVLLVEMSSKITRSRKQNLLIAGLSLALIAAPGFRVAHHTYLMTQKGTGIQTKEWIEQNIPGGSKIVREYHTPYLCQQTHPSRLMSSMGNAPLSWYKQRGFEYIVTSSFMNYRYLETDSEKYRWWAQNYKEIDEKCELVKEFAPLERSWHSPNPVIKIYRVPYDHPYVKFSRNFYRYFQTIRVRPEGKGWMLQSQISCGEVAEKNESVRDPYVRLTDWKGKEIAKLVVHQGIIGKEKLSSDHENSLFLSFLPANYRIFIGYEYGYLFDQGKNLPQGKPFKEMELNLGREKGYSRKKFSLEFFYQRLPEIHFAEYGQMVAVVKSKKEAFLWSRISGGELISGDDYVLDPYVKIVDSKGDEISKLLIYEGKVGGMGSALGPRENSVRLSFLPSQYGIYIGYEYYYDASHQKEAGGPAAIRIK